MESLLFGGCLIAVIWLAFWSERDHTRPSTRWWPFDMPGFEPPKKSHPTQSWRNASPPPTRAEPRRHP